MQKKTIFFWTLNRDADGRQQQTSFISHQKNVEFAQAQNSEGESDMKGWTHPASDQQVRRCSAGWNLVMENFLGHFGLLCTNRVTLRHHIPRIVAGHVHPFMITVCHYNFQSPQTASLNMWRSEESKKCTSSTVQLKRWGCSAMNICLKTVDLFLNIIESKPQLKYRFSGGNVRGYWNILY